MWRRVVKEAGLEGVTFHSMRHSWASWHVQGGTPLKMLQEMGGWATLDMPMRYAHLNPGHLAQYAETTAIGEASKERPAARVALPSNRPPGVASSLKLFFIQGVLRAEFPSVPASQSKPHPSYFATF